MLQPLAIHAGFCITGRVIAACCRAPSCQGSGTRGLFREYSRWVGMEFGGALGSSSSSRSKVFNKSFVSSFSCVS
ncbi:hypothetical protein PF007_g17272 [Phytophthora fragariae]|uniref:Secreted protein n=1 Tax=Phytophthora fragariae TaxID=53985 RepID=A0A6A3RFK8_9STRA|nr:hypothetical protein PF003_g7578 [Phytophthora fragariae]KAE9095726.1 hypothetical protein PF007_g17272 [Phytophthora fragariae]KAE9297412.1 hypothetical protein PF001_g16417 [Phytophthora fragariae]KAE9336513.1 hypothetical protein PF008_g12979 [Phytophthora fragariae]